MIAAVRKSIVLFTIGAFAGCGGNGVPSSAPPLSAPDARPATTSSKSPIQHVVLIVQENRSFNDFFATFTGADGTTTGQGEANPNCNPTIPAGPIPLTEMPLALAKDMNHSWKTGYSVAYDGGKMDGFDMILFGGDGEPECTYPYQYTDPSDIAPYWSLAKQYTLAEHMFTTNGSDSFTAHQDLIRGGTIVDPGKAMIDDPTCSDCFWGCDATKGTITHLITAKEKYIKNGPFPCTTDFKSPYRTLADLLDAKTVSWKYYLPPSGQINGKLFSAFDVIYDVRHGSDWNNMSSPETNILTDISSGKLAQMSWVIPEAVNSDHPGTLSNGKPADTGPQWVATVVNAVGESSYWNSTAIIIVWDDWGGLYDNMGGKLKSYAGPGERVPALIVSPYARPGYISTTTYQFGSILKYIEGNWQLGSLNTTDKTSTSIIDSFNYKQSPIAFQPISSTLGPKYFLDEHHSYQPPDDDW
jgi:phospholipase C